MNKNKILDGLIGLAIGDALGVPVEFLDRASLKINPVVDMREFGSHHQPKGTWSDDSSLTFCLAESLCNGYDIYDIGSNFVKWYYKNFWTPRGTVFDIGFGTKHAIRALKNGDVEPFEAGGIEEDNNGNGSLMRILPLAFFLRENSVEEKIRIIYNVSAITHGHKRSKIACVIYIEYAILLLKGLNKRDAYIKMKSNILEMFGNESELKHFRKIIIDDISTLSEDLIFTSGYVVDTLEASLWSVLTSSSYSESVLKAVNLGNDTDTTGAIAGGLAGLIYGINNMPKEWIDVLARKEEIFDLAERLQKKLEI